MTIIRAENIDFSYPNGSQVLCGVNFECHERERIAIIGQNGSGKTTFSKIMNGLLKADSGNLWIEEKDSRCMTTAQIAGTVGYVFQNPDDQIFNQTVFNEIAYTLRYKRIAENDIDYRVRAAAELTGLNKLLEENPYDLSYSNRKFVTIASVIVTEPKVIIMDEPTAGQDKLGKMRLENLIDILIDEGKTVITVTHDMEFVLKNFDRVVIMKDREIIADEDYKVFEREELLKAAYIKTPFCIKLAKALNMKDVLRSVEELEEQI